MNLAQITAAVYTETNRPDLVAETLQAIYEATMSLHTVENWPKDVAENVVVFNDPTLFLQQLDTTALPYYRNMSYIRKSDPSVSYNGQVNIFIPSSQTYTPGQRFDILQRMDIGDVLDMYGVEKRDVWYQAGTKINMKSSTALAQCVIGYYQYPQLSADGTTFVSWIADQAPFTIIYRAVGSIFAKIGEDKSWAIYMKPPMPGQGAETGGMYYQQLAMLLRNNIQADQE